jgi:hypothetical protein
MFEAKYIDGDCISIPTQKIVQKLKTFSLISFAYDVNNVLNLKMQEHLNTFLRDAVIKATLQYIIREKYGIFILSAFLCKLIVRKHEKCFPIWQ